MSRVGKQPVQIPSGVKVSQTREAGVVHLTVEGPKGKVSFPFRDEVTIAVEGGVLSVKRTGEEAFFRAYHGTARALIANMVRGVSQGFEKRLEIEGVGYNAKIEGKKVALEIGFCHKVHLDIPVGITLEAPKPTALIVRGADKQLVGEFAAAIRKVRPPEPYKGKGIRYTGEYVRRKVGKRA